MSADDNEKPGKIVAHHNTVVGRGGFIRAPGVRNIDAKSNLHGGDGTFIDTSDEPKKPKDNEARASRHWHEGAPGKIAITVIAGLILAGAVWLVSLAGRNLF